MITSPLFRTPLTPTPSIPRMGYGDHTVWIGSCFTENLGYWLQNHGIRSTVNPFGILYNPLSMAIALERILRQAFYSPEELHLYRGRYISFDHHGRYTGNDPIEVVERINQAITEAHQMLQKARWLFITFGSAWAFKWKKSQQVVANCHKLPGTEFERILLPLEEMESRWNTLMQAMPPTLNVVFTISPIRHQRDGAVENQRSKASLITLAHSLTERFPQSQYFPAYEIMMDDLRDYRFYKEDMIHPSKVAISYIREHFMEAFFEKNERSTFQKMVQLVNASQHRIENPDAPETQKFLSTQLHTLTSLQSLPSPPSTLHLETLFRKHYKG